MSTIRGRESEDLRFGRPDLKHQLQYVTPEKSVNSLFSGVTFREIRANCECGEGSNPVNSRYLGVAFQIFARIANYGKI